MQNSTLLDYNASLLFNSFNVILIEIFYWYIIFLAEFVFVKYSDREKLSKTYSRLQY
jgi:hypothetical protein